MLIPHHEFWWLPVEGLRHAIRRRDRDNPTGSSVHTLCGEIYERPAPPSELQWLWRTCEPCWTETCTMVGLLPRKLKLSSAGPKAG